MNLSQILIVEDQEAPREALEHAVDTVVPRYFPAYTSACRQLATCYSEASDLITKNAYDLVLLDHRMPIQPVGDLEDKNFDLFSTQLANVGYRLLPVILQQHPETLVIGTSSLSRHERSDVVAPQYAMSKMWGEAERDLDNILHMGMAYRDILEGRAKLLERGEKIMKMLQKEFPGTFPESDDKGEHGR